EAARVPFDLSKDVLLRGTLFTLATDEHILLLNLHHIVCDGWSVSVLIQELTALYTAFSTNQSPSLPDLPLQFGDFSQWHRQWLTAEMYDQQLTYWKERLGDGVPMLELPRDFPRPVMPSYEGGRHFWSLPKQVTQQLKALSQETGTTLYMTLLAAFQTLLHRYSGQDDIAVGSLLANRPHPDLEKLIGFFPNTVVMRTDMSGQPSFRELLEQVKETTLAAYKYRDLPFDQLVQALHPDHQPGQNPFFQVVFDLQNTPHSMWELPDVKVSPINLCNGTTKFDLFLELFETPDGLTGYFEYSTDLFKPTTIERMVGHFQILLDAIGYQSDQPVAMLPILPEAERQQLLLDWNQTQVDYPLEVCLHQLFEAQVEKTPDAPAIVFEGQQLTYRQLNQRANYLANYLQTVGVGPESMVGICLERSLEMVVGLLGILKSGGAYVPIDPTYPQERLGFMLTDAQVPVLLTSAAVAEQLPPCPGKQLCLDRDWEEICGVSDRNPISAVKAHNLAYVIYTSGSTGKPKGAMNTHRGIVNRLLWMQDQYQLTLEDTILQKTPFCFDVSVWEFFWPLITGAKLVVARPEGHKDRDYLVQLIAEERITTLHFVPSMLQIFLGANDLETCYSLKRVICSGEALPFDLQSRFFERLQCELHNLYGPTEAAIDVTYWQCQPDSELQKVPIGKPVANTQLYILDVALNPLPMGAVGELHIAGVQLARGYHNRPELTAEKFIFHRELDRRLYKTGDLCRFLPDGNIEYLGRVDHQVKIRGFRIELGDIESTLCQHDTIQEAVVVPWEGSTGDKQLVAYVVADQDQGEVTAAETQVQTQQWQTIFDETYRQSTTETDPTFNITGWINSYTGAPISAEAMREWVDYTVDRILAVQPKHILEIGCGTGLLLYGLAPYCQRYQGIDLSAEGIELIQDHLQQHYPDWCVDLAVGAADGVSQEALNSVDTVILNSVVQYFPDVDYLVNVLEQLIQGLPVGSHIFIGDVRSLPLLEAFHTTVQLAQADAEQSIAELRDRIQEQLAKERELVIHPEFFQALQQCFPRISHVNIQLKQGQYLNEMTQFRYDVTLVVGQGIPLGKACESLRYHPDMDINVLEQYLVQVSPEKLRVEQVHNARLAHTLAAMALLEENTAELQTVADLRDTLNCQDYLQGIDPEECWQLGAKLGYRVSISESTTQVGIYSVVFEQ
ncbi:MAG: amino acid adenylation domain-containing protein, partial [Cyanobacteria bacterium P01_D01_bin.56]